MVDVHSITTKSTGRVLYGVPGLDDDMKVDVDQRNGNKSDSDSDDWSSRHTTVVENGYQQPVETPYVENSVEELGQVCLCPVI